MIDNQSPTERIGVVVLLSGLDSAAALHHTLKTYRNVRAVSFDYGQPHARQEIAAAETIASRNDVPWELCAMPIRGTPLRAAQPGDSNGISRANIPARNLLLLAAAAGIAVQHWPAGLALLVVGCTKDDARSFPDCREPFVTAAGKALNLALDGIMRVAVVAPWQFMSKAEVVAWCAANGNALRDIRESVSCYAGTRCGVCDACTLRARAFAQTGVADVA